MVSAETSAESARHASEMAGVMWLYNALAPLLYTTEELER